MFLRQSREGRGRERGESEKSSCGGIGSLEEGSCLVHRCQTMRVGGGGGGREREREREMINKIKTTLKAVHAVHYNTSTTT